MEEDYFCPKINKHLKVSTASYELCSDCRESSSAKLRSAKLSKSDIKIDVMGESLVCHYHNRNFDIPIPNQSITGEGMGRLARIVVKEKAPKEGPHKLQIVT
jgi:hypothetical protein